MEYKDFVVSARKKKLLPGERTSWNQDYISNALYVYSQSDLDTVLAQSFEVAEATPVFISEANLSYFNASGTMDMLCWKQLQLVCTTGHGAEQDEIIAGYFPMYHYKDLELANEKFHGVVNQFLDKFTHPVTKNKLHRIEARETPIIAPLYNIMLEEYAKNGDDSDIVRMTNGGEIAFADDFPNDAYKGYYFDQSSIHLDTQNVRVACLQLMCVGLLAEKDAELHIKQLESEGLIERGKVPYSFNHWDS